MAYLLPLAIHCTADAALLDANGVLQAPVEGVADEGVTDRYLIHPWNALDEVLQILGVEVVASIQTKTHAACLLRSCYIGSDGSLAVCSIARSVCLGVELHAVGTTLLSRCNHLYHRVYED